jgi:hypothetical protein
VCVFRLLSPLPDFRVNFRTEPDRGFADYVFGKVYPFYSRDQLSRRAAWVLRYILTQEDYDECFENTHSKILELIPMDTPNPDFDESSDDEWHPAKNRVNRYKRWLEKPNRRSDAFDMKSLNDKILDRHGWWVNGYTESQRIAPFTDYPIYFNIPPEPEFVDYVFGKVYPFYSRDELSQRAASLKHNSSRRGGPLSRPQRATAG